jgi:hypothetical protein
LWGVNVITLFALCHPRRSHNQWQRSTSSHLCLWGTLHWVHGSRLVSTRRRNIIGSKVCNFVYLISWTDVVVLCLQPGDALLTREWVCLLGSTSGHWGTVGAIQPASNGYLLMRPLWPQPAASWDVATSNYPSCKATRLASLLVPWQKYIFFQPFRTS